MYILGFNCYVFNSAAALIRDGEILASAQEERFTRKKHTGDFPENAIRYCLSEAGITVDDLDIVCFHWRPFHHFHRRLLQIAGNLPGSVRFFDTHSHRWRNMVFAFREFDSRLRPRGRRALRYERVQHHVCHASSAFYASPFDEAALLTVDGSGEMASSTMGVGRGLDVTLTDRVLFPHSLGYLYVAVTHYLGFTPDSDEYKVMALASYGEAEFYDAFKKVVRPLAHGKYELDLSYFNFQRGLREPWVSDRFIRTFGPLRKKGEPLTQRQKDVAWALQRTLEDTVLHMARHLHSKTRMKYLCYAGGTALNSVLNTRLARETPFQEIFIPPAANDAGTPVGSALHVYHALLRQPRKRVMLEAALGPSFSDDRCRAALQAAGFTWRELEQPDLARETARLIADGKVIAWFQGRMETGPRALGHRSILADPRRADMKEILNEKVKHREGFRPFAPSVLAERATEYFDCDRPSPFMLFVYNILPHQLHAIPAVAHVDGTARVQTVDRATDPVYWGLIHEFDRLTGVPLVLNTSFNVMGEPIVCTPEDAVACFRATRIDALAMNRLLVLK